jgi:hypothetical protein
MMFLGHQFDLPRAQKMLEWTLEIDPLFADRRFDRLSPRTAQMT